MVDMFFIYKIIALAAIQMQKKSRKKRERGVLEIVKERM
jgi:hypothetical protein